MSLLIGFFRFLRHRIRLQERLLTLRARAKPKGLLARMKAADIIAFNQRSLSRGMAVGMFWCFVPMPFQMAPATLFCWMARANLPIAIICVWISNPFTYAPILYFQYRVGMWLFDRTGGMSQEQFKAYYNNGELWDMKVEFLLLIMRPLMEGALITASVMAIIGYVSGLLFFNLLALKKRNASHSR